MMVTFRTEGPPCGMCRLRPRGIEVATVRVNRRSLRATGFVLGGMPWRCEECRFPLWDTRRVRELDPEDAAKVAAYRERKWPVPVAVLESEPPEGMTPSPSDPPAVPDGTDTLRAAP